jgi:hypothetical protein
MKKFVLLAVSTVLLLANANAFDVKLLQNNKEAFSRELSKELAAEAESWSAHHKLGADLQRNALRALQDSFNALEKVDTTCELGLVAQLQKDAMKYGVIESNGEVLDLAGYLRHSNLIDDILYNMIKKSTYVSLDFVNNAAVKAPRPFNVYTAQTNKVDVEKLYAPVKNWPDDIKSCTIDTYFDMVSNLTFKNSKERDGLISKLNYIAYSKGILTLEGYNKMETMRKRAVLDWPIYLKRYADVINNAKDKLTKTPEAKSTNNFAQDYVSRRDSLTQRGNLYSTYNSTQIMILAQIIEKTAKRMDAKRAALSWQYSDDPADQEIYVLSPMEQYRAAIKMLRKDMGDVMKSEAFKNTALEYEHLIAAAYEAGFIKSAELDMILKFEDFWNPKQSRWKTYANFAFSLAGTASFYLPPPWNIIGAIGLVLTQAKFVEGEPKPNPNDNWNVII